MSITLRPYIKDKTRYHVDMQIEHPTTQLPLRKRIAAPAGLDERQAQRWGEKELEKWVKLLALPNPSQEEPRTPEPVDTSPLPSRQQGELTLERFYTERFEPTHIRLQRPSTRTSWDCHWRHNLQPVLGSWPLGAIDLEALDRLKAELAARLDASTINLALGKLGKMLRWALQRKLISGMPLIERIKVDKEPRPHYDEDQIEVLRKALSRLPPEDVIVFILGFECGLRTGEVAALRWIDVNLKKGMITVAKTFWRGHEGPAKGTIGSVGITRLLADALARVERRGVRVLYRRSHHTKGEWSEHTEHSIQAALHRLQRLVGFDETGLHLLRHSGITYLADRGEDIYTVQAFARHARLQTTEGYIHQSKQKLASKAARAFDGNNLATAGNKPEFAG